LTEKDAQLTEKNAQLTEKDNILKGTVRLLTGNGMTIEQIAATLNVDIDKLQQLANDLI